MNINFKSIKLKNFGSYEEATVHLQNKGFCAVQGRNNFKKDNAFSNGSGKSMIGSAICFALTGETIKGVKSQLKNRLNDDPDSFVSLTFSVDGDEYVVNRIIAPKSDLTISKNGIDVSGKGIRESEKKLGELLPDLTKELIASTIIIGQGMPNKLSSFTPAGRKELLEKLTKSDFMIEEIKHRIGERQAELAKQQREYDDVILVATTNLNTANTTLLNAKNELARFTPIDYALELFNLETDLFTENDNIKKYTQNLNETETVLNGLSSKLLALTEAKSTELSNLATEYSNLRDPIVVSHSNAQAELKLTEAEIGRMEAIKDVCPTCGRKLDNIVKPDTTAQRKAAEILRTNIAVLKETLNTAEQENQASIKRINEKYSAETASLNTDIAMARQTKLDLQTQIGDSTKKAQGINNQILSVRFNKENDAKRLAFLQNAIETAEQQIVTLTTTIDGVKQEKINLQQHIEVVKKIDTLVKRDFRGYLLTNIINFLNKKAKEYSEVVYGTQELDIFLDGNVLEITYCGKNFDNLSGGEQQRVDLILQFAIRDMLSTYLDYSSNILFIDEVFDNLDKIATDRVLELITTKLKDIESLFIISHHSESLNIGYDCAINITKNEDGISEVTEE